MRFQKAGNLRIYSTAVFVAVGTLLATVGVGVASSDGEIFTSPEQAAKALVSAAESRNETSILKILGPSAEEILTTSDPVGDRRERETFVRRAKEKMLVATDPKWPDQRILQLGNDSWSFPIPIVRTAGKWRFDVNQGMREVLLTRIESNELTAIDVCRGYVEAQNKYFAQDRTGSGVLQYAQNIISSTGKRDGLYWRSTNPDDESPMAQLVARAVAEGYKHRTEPYHGYYFKVLKGQGPHASGGAMSYLEDGAMTGGFALIAWPSDYRSTGVMTFLVDRAGIVCQKDLGEKTAHIAGITAAYDPDETWIPVSGSGIPKNPTPNTSQVVQ